MQQLRLFRIIIWLLRYFTGRGTSSTSGPEVPSEDLVNQRRGLSLPVQPARREHGDGKVTINEKRISDNEADSEPYLG